jgi:MoaA/NifB/PqqE/SkfB family radical SAM enzyme
MLEGSPIPKLAGPYAPHFKARCGPSGIHLFNRTTGINVLLDEVIVPKTLWSLAPRQVSIALTNACDLACRHCYAPKRAAVLDYARVCGWLAELEANGCLGIGFGGGEPTLYRRFAKLCAYATHETGLAVTFTTHAHHLNVELMDALKGNVNFVRISMDGIGGTYEALRGRPFGALCQKLHMMRKFSAFGINYVVNSRTFAELDEATKLAADMGAVEFLLLPEQPSSGGCGIDDQTTSALREWVNRHKGIVRLAVSEAGANGLPCCNPLAGEPGLRAYAHIDASSALKQSSYQDRGVPIEKAGIMAALKILRSQEQKASR